MAKTSLLPAPNPARLKEAGSPALVLFTPRQDVPALPPKCAASTKTGVKSRLHCLSATRMTGLDARAESGPFTAGIGTGNMAAAGGGGPVSGPVSEAGM